MSDAFEHIRNYRVVDARLASSGQPNETDLAAIAAAGYEVVINLALHDDPRYALADEAGTVAALGLAYVHIPVQFAAPQASDLTRFMRALDDYRTHRVWIHCAANYRVSAFLGLYRMRTTDCSREQAFALMDSVWQPDAVWSTFIEAHIAS